MTKRKRNYFLVTKNCSTENPNSSAQNHIDCVPLIFVGYTHILLFCKKKLSSRPSLAGAYSQLGPEEKF